MFIAMRAAVQAIEDRRVRRHVAGGLVLEASTMIWETPVAIDFRFGMEITMYVSNR